MDKESVGRASGLRQVRRWTNWTAAALIGATALTTGYFARASLTAAPATAIPGTALGTAGTAGRLGPGGAPGTSQPCVYVPVATSGGSGVRAQTPVLSCGPGTGTPGVLSPAQVGAGQGGWSREAEGHDS
jgi:hypothetical protein